MQGDIVRQLDNVPTRNTLLVTRLINTRANLLDASRIVEEAALDKYSFLRDAYLQRRQSLIYDGNPPREPSAAVEGQDGVASEETESIDAPKVSESETLPTSTAAVQVTSVVK